LCGESQNDKQVESAGNDRFAFTSGWGDDVILGGEPFTTAGLQDSVEFALADLHRDAASLAGATANAIEDSADGAGGAARMYRFDLLGGDACNLGDDGDAYGGVAVLGYVCLVTFVLAI
jgi:hypothetical protein